MQIEQLRRNIRDTCMIPVWAVPELFWNTAKGIRGISIFQLSLYFQNFPILFSGRTDSTHK